jgi:general nucleoside transport system permease protein
VIGSLRARILEGGLEFVLSATVAIVGLMIALVFVVASGVSPGSGASAFISGAFGTKLNLAGTLAKTVPLSLVGIAWIVTSRAGRIHVGFPGQIIMGGLLVSLVAIKINVPLGLHLPLVLLAGMVGGALYAGIAAVLWAKRGVNEILSTLLLNLVAAEIIAWWVRQPLHDHSTPLPLTPQLPASAFWPSLLSNTDLHWDIVLVPIVVALIAFVLARTSFGFKLRIVGANERLARDAGISAHRVGVSAIVLSGAIAGLAGASLVAAGTTPAMGEDFEGGFGFAGIAVALLARNSPLGVIPAALLFAAVIQGGGVMEGTVGIDSSLVTVVQGVMIILVLAATTLLYLQRRRRSRIGGPRPSRSQVEPVVAELRTAE